MFSRIAAALLGLCLMSTPAMAADANGSAALHGIGGIPCKVLVVERSQAGSQLPNQQVLDWLLGYWSAINATFTDVFEVAPSFQEVDLYRRVYDRCVKNPAEIVQQAAQGVLIANYGARIKRRSDMVEFRNDYGSIKLRQEMIASIQVSLKKLELFDGYIDGTFTKALEASVSKFQTLKKLPKTGLPDSETIAQIFAAVSAKSATDQASAAKSQR